MTIAALALGATIIGGLTAALCLASAAMLASRADDLEPSRDEHGECLGVGVAVFLHDDAAGAQ